MNLSESACWKSIDIADAIRLVSDVKLWEEVAARLSRTAQDVKEQLNLIVERRNKIAHEADMDPTLPGRQWLIDTTLVNEAIDFIENVAEAVYDILK